MFNYLINFLFPKCCLGCDTILLKNENTICNTCQINLPFTYQHLTSKEKTHPKFYGKVAIESALCLLYFNKGGIVQRLFHQLKYKDHPEISYYLGKIYAEQLRDTQVLNDVDEIIMVPMHLSKMKKRGYNQVEGFAKAISETFDIPINDKILFKTKESISQTKKTRIERSNHKIEEFDISQSNTNNSKHFVLLDDILTTGATLEACCKKLHQIPDLKLTILCLAQTV